MYLFWPTARSGSACSRSRASSAVAKRSGQEDADADADAAVTAVAAAAAAAAEEATAEPAGRLVVRDAMTATLALALPLQTKAVRRVNASDDSWLQALRSAAAAEGTLVPLGTWWEVAEPRGSGGSVSCLKVGHQPSGSAVHWPPRTPTPSGGVEGRMQRPMGGSSSRSPGAGRTPGAVPGGPAVPR